MGIEASETGPSGSRDHITILSGTSQNVIGIVIAAAATFAANILITRTLGAERFGAVTLLTQGAFVLSFATRAGMDMAVLRDVAIEVGAGRWARIRTRVARAAVVALGVSIVVGLIGVVAADSIRSILNIGDQRGNWVVEAACLGLPFLALANVWLSATRGLKIMRYTLYIFWAGQPLAWIAAMLIGWQFSRSAWMTVVAYSLSWALASISAWWCWYRESKVWPVEPLQPGDMNRLVRYAGPRAPAALFSQLLFWTDLFVLTQFVGEVEVGVYSAALRAGQVMVLFLTSVSLMFSPFVADLHNRGETERLDGLFKSLTRWTLAATIPAFLLLLVAPEPALRLFGSEFTEGRTALLILLAGQFINVATGSVGFVLIMVGRTGWDLIVYAGSLVLNVGIALWLCPDHGMTGAAIANSVTFAVSKWARLALVRKFVGIQPYDAAYGRLVAPAIAAGLAMWALHSQLPEDKWLLDLAGTGLGGVVAFGLVYLVIGLTPAERHGIRRMTGRIRAGMNRQGAG
jgi:O-antigen/teichoic acid export membrane protein